MNQIPIEVMDIIFTYCDLKSIVLLSSSSRGLSQIVTHSSIWKTLTVKLCIKYNINSLNTSSQAEFKKLYLFHENPSRCGLCLSPALFRIKEWSLNSCCCLIK